MSIHLSGASQIDKDNLIQVTGLHQDMARTKIPLKYTDYADVFSLDLAIDLSKNNGINKHVMELIGDK